MIITSFSQRWLFRSVHIFLCIVCEWQKSRYISPKIIHTNSFATGFLLLFKSLCYTMGKNALSPDLTGKLPWSVLMGQLHLPPSLQHSCIPQCQKLLCSRGCKVGDNWFTVCTVWCGVFLFDCLFCCLFVFPPTLIVAIVVNQDDCVVKCCDRGYCLIQHP